MSYSRVKNTEFVFSDFVLKKSKIYLSDEKYKDEEFDVNLCYIVFQGLGDKVDDASRHPG